MTLESLYESIEKDYKKITNELNKLIETKKSTNQEVKENITLTKKVRRKIETFIKNQKEFLENLLSNLTDLQKKTINMGGLVDNPDDLTDVITLNIQLLEMYRNNVIDQLREL